MDTADTRAFGELSLAERSRYRESAVHGTPGFPMRIYANNFSWYVNNIIDWHWHPELEIAVVLSGRVRCSINGTEIEAGKGEGFFINSNIMHMETPVSGDEEPLMTTVCFMPEFIGDCGSDLIYRRYVRPVITDQSLKGMKLTPEAEWQERILSGVRQLMEIAERREWGYELELRNAVAGIWFTLVSKLKIDPGETISAGSGAGEKRLKKMLTHIHENYTHEMTIDDIARSASVSKSECFRCFRNMIGRKPVEYLNEYRLQAAAELLVSTDMQITEVCFACGFNHISYFGKLFRQYYGTTPKEFRRMQTAGKK